MSQEIPQLKENKTEQLIMTSKDVVDIFTQLKNAGIEIWIDGGWSIDALLSKQLRPHKDLDIAIRWKDVPKLREVLGAQEYKQVREDSQWNFVLADNKGREVDVHAFVYDDKGNVVDGIMYPAESLTGSGLIDGQPVKCISPKYMVEFLAPYIHKWPEKYLSAVYELCKKFEIELPKEYSVEQKMDIDGLRIRYFILGNKQNPTLVFVHGWPMNLVTLKTIDSLMFINELAKYFYVIIPQLPGFFRSEPPKNLWSMENYADFAHQFIRKLNLDKPILMGKSFGGGVAAMYAYKYSSDISKLILVDSATVPERTKLTWFKIVKPIAVLSRWLIVRSWFPFVLKKIIISKFVGVPKEFIQRDNFARYLIMVDIFISYSRYFDARAIKVPTLIVWGEKDRVTPFREAKRLNKEIPSSKLITFPGGHLVFETKPKEVISGIMNALRNM